MTESVGRIRVHRSTDGRDSHAIYSVHIDGVAVGKLRRDEVVTVDVEPGGHVVVLRGAAGYMSEPFTAAVHAGETVRLVCFPAVTTMSTWVSLMWGKQSSEPGIRLQHEAE